MKLTGGVEGWFKIEAYREGVPDSRRVVADWFPNLILDAGLERMGANTGYIAACRVGAGSTPVSPLDNALVSLVASTTSQVGGAAGAQSSAPYFGWRRNTYRFAEGAAAGNLSEVGVGWGATALFSRALILDSAGNPTTITVLPDETLDVTYELRTYPPAVDSSGTVVMGGVTYNWVARAASVTNSDIWAQASTGSLIYPYSSFGHSGSMGPITGIPSGTSAPLTTVRGGYASNSKKIAITVSAPLNQGNVAGGIRSIRSLGGSSGLGAYQIEFDPVIPKDATKVFSLTFEIAWERRV